MTKQTAAIPRPALILGLGGLLPFFATAIAICLSQDPPLFNQGSSDLFVHALATYGAVILSFLGGIRWGKLLGDNEKLDQWAPLTLSILPSLIAWAALLLESRGALLLLMAGFAWQYFLDRTAVRQHELPGWFGHLRLILTCGALISLLTGWVTLSLHT